MELISKEDAVALITAEMDKIRTHSLVDGTARINLRLAKNIIEDMPSIDLADYVPKDFHDKTCEAMAKRHQEEIADILKRADADRPQGEWVEKTKFHNADDDPIIEEWQSAKCSVCGKYHTTPYLYYFDDCNYCPNCGAKMKGAGDE